MTKPLYFDYSLTYNSPTDFNISIYPINPEIITISSSFGANVVLGPNNPPTTFLTLQNGLDYYKVTTGIGAQFVTDINTYFGSTVYHDGGWIRNITENFDEVNNKVDKITGKGLSTEDYTTAEKTKLAGIADGATNTAAPVNPDWNASSGLAQILNKPSIPSALNPTVNNNVSRSLNSSYTISSNVRGAVVSYSINASWTLNALLSGSGTATLQYSVDNGTNWITVNNVGKGLNLLTFAGSDDMNLSGFIPSAATNTRIVTTATNMTVTYTRGQEVLL